MNFDALARDVLVALFRQFPHYFVLIGGGALHWIFHSPRLSLDIDLKPLKPSDRLLGDMRDALRKPLALFSAREGFTLDIEIEPTADALIIVSDQRPVLRIELVSVAPVTAGEKHLFQNESLDSEIIVTPTLNQLLFSKAVALVKRPRLKGRDVFDIWFLQSRGASLDAAVFSEWLKWEEKDREDLATVLKNVTSKRLAADLHPFLPPSIQRQLAEDQYKSLIQAAHRLFEPFL
jgi:hypothetical protein